MTRLFLLIITILAGYFACTETVSGYIQEKQDSVLIPGGRISLTILSKGTIYERGWYVNSLQAFGKDMLVAHGETWKRQKGQSADWWQFSIDNGASWQPYVKTNGKDLTMIRSNMCLLMDGSIAGWSGEWNRDTSFCGRPGKPVTQKLMRASSIDEVVRGKGIVKEATISIPYMVPLTGDDIKSPPNYVPAVWGKLIEVEHGYLIQGTYPRLAYDNSSRLWPEQKSAAFKYRTCIIYSRDDGATWNYLATVASPEQYPLPAQAEGYCEPDLLHFGKGRILCVIRSGGNPAGNLQERYTPLVSSHSLDGGLTWSPPEAIAPYGVDPILLQMKSGLVVCLSGRPGFFLLFSKDNGKTWSVPYWLSKSNGQWSRSSSGYGQLTEMEPGILGVAYDEYEGEGESARMVAKFTRILIRHDETSK